MPGSGSGDVHNVNARYIVRSVNLRVRSAPRNDADTLGELHRGQLATEIEAPADELHPADTRDRWVCIRRLPPQAALLHAPGAARRLCGACGAGLDGRVAARKGGGGSVAGSQQADGRGARMLQVFGRARSEGLGGAPQEGRRGREAFLRIGAGAARTPRVPHRGASALRPRPPPPPPPPWRLL